MTRDELVTAITNQADYFDVAGNLSYVQGLLDLGLEDVASRAEWPWMVTAATLTPTASTASEALDSATFSAIKSITRSDGTRLQVVQPHEAFAEYGNPPSEGQLRWVFYMDDEIHYAPIPEANETVTIVYIGTTATDLGFAGGTAQPPFAARFHNALIEYALWRIWEREEDYVKAQSHRGIYYEILGTMLAAYEGGLGRARIVLGEPNTSQSYGPRMPWLEV